MNLISKLWHSLFQQKAEGFTTNRRYDIINGNIINSPDNKLSYINSGYNINDIIYSIVNLISEKVKMAPWAVYKVTDEDALKSYRAIISKKELSADDWVKAANLRRKALQSFDGDDKLNELLDFPNEYQTFSDLVGDSSAMKLLTGDRLIWAEMLAGGLNAGKPQTLHLLPTQEISLIVSRNWPMTIEGYKLDKFGLINLAKEAVLHDKYFNPNCDSTGMHLWGQAPMKAAMNLTDRSNSENKIAMSAYQNGGPKSIVFVDEPQFAPEQKGQEAKQIKSILTSNEYRGPNNSNKLAASGYKIGVVPVGLSPVELDIIASEMWSLRRFCNVFGGVPSQLLNDPENKVYNNTVEGEKALTSRCALPLLNSFRNHFNRKLYNDWGYKGKNIVVDYDITVFTELQENMRDKWEWVKQLPVPNSYKLDLMGLDHPEGQEEFMDQILVPTGYELSDSYGQNEVDTALDEGDGKVSENSRGKEMPYRTSHNGKSQEALL